MGVHVRVCITITGERLEGVVDSLAAPINIVRVPVYRHDVVHSCIRSGPRRLIIVILIAGVGQNGVVLLTQRVHVGLKLSFE